MESFYATHSNVMRQPFFYLVVCMLCYTYIYILFFHNKLVLISVQPQTLTRNLLRARDSLGLTSLLRLR